MTLLITVFGGMLLTVLLYGAARFLKLSNFWAAVAAAGLPSLAYLVFAAQVWPGLDVVTLHIVTYPTVAVLLFQMYAHKPGRDLTVHWVPKLLIAFFVVITVLYGGFVYIAGQGLPPALARMLLPDTQGKNIHTGFAGAMRHGEEAAKSIGQQRNIAASLDKLGWNVEIHGVDGMSSERAGEIKVLLRQRDGAQVTGQQLRFSTIRPGQEAETGQLMSEVAPGDYRLQAALPGPGVWLAVVSFMADGRRIDLEREVGMH